MVMNEKIIAYVVVALLLIAGGYVLYYSTIGLIDLHTGIIERLHTPTNLEVLPDHMNKDLTCHKVGLYTDWGEGIFDFSKYISGIDVGKHARQMFFEYDCSLTCNKSLHGDSYWQSNKVCIAELYPHE